MHHPRLLRNLAILLISAGPAKAAVPCTATFSDTATTARSITNTQIGIFTDALASTSAQTINGGVSATPFRTDTGDTLTNFNPDENVENAVNGSVIPEPSAAR